MIEDEIRYKKYVKNLRYGMSRTYVDFTDENVAKDFMEELEKCDRCEVSQCELINNNDNTFTVNIFGGCRIIEKHNLLRLLNKKVNIKKYLVIEKKPMTAEESGQYVEMIKEINGG